MRTYSISDLLRRSRGVIADALRHPVAITVRTRPRPVLLSVERYQRLVSSADARRSGTIDTMPDDMFEDLKAAVRAYEAEGEV